MLPCIMAEEKLEKTEPPIFVIPSGITTCLLVARSWRWGMSFMTIPQSLRSRCLCVLPEETY